jgi:hypothetical protein
VEAWPLGGVYQPSTIAPTPGDPRPTPRTPRLPVSSRFLGCRLAGHPRTAAEFEQDGFAVLSDFLEPSEIDGLRADVDAALAAPLPPGCERPHNTLVPLSWSHGIVQRLLGSDRRIQRLATTIGAKDLRWISAYVSVKEPHTDALWWHQDWWCWSHPVSYRRPAPQVAVLCYLTDTRAETAALRILPGTHLRSIDLHSALPEAHAREATELSTDEPAMRGHPDEVTLELRAGDAVVADYRLLHGTHPNSSEHRRDCLILSFTPSWRDLPDELRAHLIRHPAQPSRTATPADAGAAGLLPSYDGEPRDLPLERTAPARFEAVP